jgi:hypothetical protein
MRISLCLQLVILTVVSREVVHISRVRTALHCSPRDTCKNHDTTSRAIWLTLRSENAKMTELGEQPLKHHQTQMLTKLEKYHRCTLLYRPNCFQKAQHE